MALEVSIQKKLGAFALDVRFEGGREILALLGASGCGKSMTLKCIAGIETPDSGRIVLDGRVLFDADRRIKLTPQKRRVGYLFQQYALFPNMTVAQNIACGVPEKRGRAEKVGQLVQSMYLEGEEGKYPYQLSGGQQQRVALARILASEPEMLMLDEPFSALDSYLRWQLELQLTDVLRAYDKTTLFVSHSRDEVYRICDRVCVIRDGKSSPPLAVRSLFENPRTVSAALLSGCKNFTDIVWMDAHTVRSEAWGAALTVLEGEGAARCIGVRSHFILPAAEGETQNTMACAVIRIIEDVFSMVLMIRPLSAPEGADADIRMEIDKAAAADIREGDTIRVRINPEDIMLLTKEDEHV